MHFLCHEALPQYPTAPVSIWHAMEDHLLELVLCIHLCFTDVTMPYVNLKHISFCSITEYYLNEILHFHK